MNIMKRVLMDIDTNLFRLALLENGEPVEFYVERKQTESLVASSVVIIKNVSSMPAGNSRTSPYGKNVSL